MRAQKFLAKDLISIKKTSFAVHGNIFSWQEHERNPTIYALFKNVS
jgi:hypothetical protein